jgi:hypothetical protein
LLETGTRRLLAAGDTILFALRVRVTVFRRVLVETRVRRTVFVVVRLHLVAVFQNVPFKVTLTVWGTHSNVVVRVENTVVGTKETILIVLVNTC